MPTIARHASSTPRSAGRFITLLSVRAGGSSETNGLPAHYLRAVVDARLAERARVLREQIAVTRRMVRELGR